MKQSKLYSLALTVLFLGLQIGVAQKTVSKGTHKVLREQIQEQKRNFLLEKLELSAEQSKELQQILIELDEERYKLWQSLREQRVRLHRGEPLSEAEYNTYLDALLDKRVEEAELERRYYKKCKGIIPTEKLIKLQKLNKEFAKHFLRSRNKQ